MPWNRYFFGHVTDRGLVHVVYEEHKGPRLYWDLQWRDRNNTSVTDAPSRVSMRPTCLQCIAMQLSLGARL